ncbi:MAG: chitobiase/beta-hexosaminidase C-terminal domain-containing protein [Lachnospiraceae bacterium]|nr:chitobiase/beta-hexosaminidase C-terminal domain-containing protein [Lachnospiraceae bacterium]
MRRKHPGPESGMREERKSTGRKKKIVIFVLAVAALAVILAVLFTLFRKSTKIVTEYLELGENYMDELNYEEAVVAFQEAIRLDPKNTDASLGLGRAYEGAEEYEQAEAAYLSSIDRVSDCGDLYEALAELYIRLDRLEDAEALLEEAVSQTDDEDVMALYEKTQPQPPTASLAPGTYDTWQRLELSSAYSSEIIYYTTDGSEPGEDSSMYQEPIILPAGKTVIQAKVVNDRGYESEVATYEYMIDRDAQEITFTDEVMERVVRTKLNIWNTPITDEDVATIQSLTIVGDYFEDSEESLSGINFTEE